MLLSIDDLPPDAPCEQVQRVSLSDGRWLQLILLFDGMGLSCEVTYFDSTLTHQLEEHGGTRSFATSGAPAEKGNGGLLLPLPGLRSLAIRIRQIIRPLFPTSVVAWAFGIAIAFGVAGYFILPDGRSARVLDAHRILDQSIQAELAGLHGQTEHQVLRFEKLSHEGSVLANGSIDFWKDADGKRYMRRLYDDQHRLIAAEWTQRNGQRGRYPDTGRTARPLTGNNLLYDNLWKQEMGSSASTLWPGKVYRFDPMETDMK